MMESQEIRRVNIKKKKNRSLYFGVAVDTGELLAVDAVPRGLDCRCICPACSTRLEARKGDKKVHHFAHETNNECHYGPELSIYRAFFAFLQKNLKFYLPDAILKFNSYKKPETVRKGYLQDLTNVELISDPGKYPPTLLCSAGSNKFQLVLNIENYYNKSDYSELAAAGKEANIAVIAVDVESVDDITSTDDLSKYILEAGNKTWLYNRVVEEWDKRYREAAVRPTEFESGHLCLAQKYQFKNVYSALMEDCISCQYCYDFRVEAFCLAHSYINHVDDFKKPLTIRKQEFEKANQIKPIKKISEHQCPQCGAPLRRRNGPNGVFAGCSRYPECKGSRQVEQSTEQVIIYDRKKSQYRKW
jgi:ssDNA-binding Zn-finger/Zn-ribbon topoisomerase 1